MKTIELTYPHILKVDKLPEIVAAIGFFDGIHKGHQRVIQTAIQKAKDNNMKSAVITFHPHPSVVLKEDAQHVKYITPVQEKRDILQQLNVDYLYIIKFTKELSQLSPQKFIDHFIKKLNVKHLIAGFDFTFGYKGQGNMQNISSYSKDAFLLTKINQVSRKHEKISSTKIRKHLIKGEVDEVNHLLGRPFSFTGIVVDGDKRGKTIGFPTANLKLNENVLLPMSGVYAVKVFHNDNIYEGIANIGVKPTFNDDQMEQSVEVHILDYQHEIYGETLKIEWYHFIREEKKFSGVDELVNQIKQDEITVRKYFSAI